MVLSVLRINKSHIARLPNILYILVRRPRRKLSRSSFFKMWCCDYHTSPWIAQKTEFIKRVYHFCRTVFVNFLHFGNFLLPANFVRISIWYWAMQLSILSFWHTKVIIYFCQKMSLHKFYLFSINLFSKIDKSIYFWHSHPFWVEKINLSIFSHAKLLCGCKWL